jgi:hypothetical protein
VWVENPTNEEIFFVIMCARVHTDDDCADADHALCRNLAENNRANVLLHTEELLHRSPRNCMLLRQVFNFNRKFSARGNDLHRTFSAFVILPPQFPQRHFASDIIQTYQSKSRAVAV